MSIEQQAGACQWFDLAHEWRIRTGLPWVPQFGPPALKPSFTPVQLVEDLNRSRINGMAHVKELVAEWTPRIALAPATIHTYLTENIFYDLDAPCLEALKRFRQYAFEIGILPPLPEPRFL